MCGPGPVALAMGGSEPGRQKCRLEVRQSGDEGKEEAEGPPRPTFWRCGQEDASQARPEFSWATGGAVVFVYIKKGRGERGRRRKWELLRL